MTLFNQQRYIETVNLAWLMTDKFPLDGFGWKVLGAALKQLGRNDDALIPMQKAAALTPNDDESHNNLGITLKELNRPHEAEISYRRALEINQEFADAFSNLGVILYEMGQLDQAVDKYKRAIQIEPDHVEALSNLGNVLRELGQLDNALASCRRALEANPTYVEAHGNIGNALRDNGKIDEAMSSFRRALEIKPDYAEAHSNLGNALQDLGQLDDAVASYCRALEIKPDYAEAHSNLGNALQDLGQLDDALASFRRALEIKPDYADAYSNLGILFQAFGHLEGAVTCFRRALEIKPNFADAQSNMLFILNFHPDLSREEVFREAQEYEVLRGMPLRPLWPVHHNDKNPERRLRIGYVSPDFRNHAVAYFAEPVLANHDKSQVEIFCYAEVRREDDYTGRFRKIADHWHSTVGLTDEAVAQMIREHRIDILVDLAGHTARNRLLAFARKPAPIQITYLGYPGTTGLSAMDYRITDHYADPEGIADAYYAERLLRLPGSLCCYRPSVDLPETSVLPALTQGYLTFGSFNNCNKIDQPTLDLWAELLRALPTSRLMMLTVPKGEVRQRFVNRFARFGIAAERLEFHGKLSSAEFHRKFLEVDFALDTVNVSGGTTTCESLWMGVPVIAMVGESFITRVSYSFLSTVGLADFAAFSAKDYIRIATHHADNLPLLADIRAGLRAHVAASQLIDEVGFTRNLENLYRNVWQKWCGAT